MGFAPHVAWHEQAQRCAQWPQAPTCSRPSFWRGRPKQAQRAFPSGKEGPAKRQGPVTKTRDTAKNTLRWEWAFGLAQTNEGQKKNTPAWWLEGRVQPNAPTDDVKGSPGSARAATDPSWQARVGGTTNGNATRASGDAPPQDRRKSRVAGMRKATECGISALKRHRNHRTRTLSWDTTSAAKATPHARGLCPQSKRRVRHQAINGLSLRRLRPQGRRPERSPTQPAKRKSVGEYPHSREVAVSGGRRNAE